MAKKAAKKRTGKKAAKKEVVEVVEEKAEPVNETDVTETADDKELSEKESQNEAAENPDKEKDKKANKKEGFTERLKTILYAFTKKTGKKADEEEAPAKEGENETAEESDEDEDKKTSKKESLAETLKTIVYALLIAGVFRTVFFQPFWIPSGSMKDTLLVGDFLFVNKMAYGYSRYSCPFEMCPIKGRLFGREPERGDIVVFRHPVTNQDYIKRLIGMPGDRVRMVNGVLHLNGEPVPTTRNGTFEEVYEPQGTTMFIPRTIKMIVNGIKTREFTFPPDPRRTPSCANGIPAEGGICEKERFTEVLPNGVSHSILNIRKTSNDTTPTFIVPEKHYFFMGDNRDNSVDSRVPQSAIFQPGVGMVAEEYLIGRADRVIFSAEGASIVFFWTWRSDRFFKRLD